MPKLPVQISNILKVSKLGIEKYRFFKMGIMVRYRKVSIPEFGIKTTYRKVSIPEKGIDTQHYYRLRHLSLPSYF